MASLDLQTWLSLISTVAIVVCGDVAACFDGQTLTSISNFTDHSEPTRRTRQAFEDSSMPIISTFFGITIRMYFADHGPPHIHVEYHGREALIDIASGIVLAGGLPSRALALVCHWRVDHAAELAQNWARAQALQPLARIAGADND